MVGSPLIGAVIAQWAFWFLLAIGVAKRSLKWRQLAVLVALWLAGYLGLPRLAWWTGPLVASWVAVLDIALVLMVFKGDVRLT